MNKLQQKYITTIIDHFARCKQRWSRSTSCFSFLTLHKSWDKIQPTEHCCLWSIWNVFKLFDSIRKNTIYQINI